MKSLSVLRLVAAAFVMAAFPLPSVAQVSIGIGIGINAGFAPPAIPYYEQPELPAPNEIWTPGYWAYGEYGYYWVPGTWVYAPEPGYLWTPGYWGWYSGRYGWHDGYWGTSVGYYGGVNYGAGYYGNGYVGGRWDGRTFRYNHYVSRVGPSYSNYTYGDRRVYVNDSAPQVGYNGGPHGVQARPTSQQAAFAATHHVGMTSVQVLHVRTAAQDRSLLATVNHNRPPVLAVAHPLSTTNRPVAFAPIKSADRTGAQHAVPAYHAPAAHAAPAYHAPAAHAAPAYHAPAAHAYHAPAVHAAPAYHAPAVHAAPQHAAPPAHAAPQHAAPPAPHAAPPAHAAPQHAAPPHGDEKPH